MHVKFRLLSPTYWCLIGTRDAPSITSATLFLSLHHPTPAICDSVTLLHSITTRRSNMESILLILGQVRLVPVQANHRVYSLREHCSSTIATNRYRCNLFSLNT
ncbi:hypothetical protein PENSPDRAFT_654070 [Peniophora sp. CONT]|nr:hypothetical protein PENSPDRAFT_654070 [Peniophora sp. CONT]